MYLGLKTTGKFYGKKHERAPLSNHVRRQEDERTVDEGVDDWIDDEMEEAIRRWENEGGWCEPT